MKLIEDKLILISSSELLNYVNNFNGIILINFFANWCKYCKNLEKTLNSIDLSFSKIELVKVDVDKFSFIAKSSEFLVKTVPTIFIFKFGVLVSKIENSSITRENLEKILNFD
ncbi:MAG TPA: thioredoxin family protein [Mycoplasmatales bacterium]|jgi:thioredoxin 1|nr:thioredoxin family protein [Mycoplasmatales bacterium]